MWLCMRSETPPVRGDENRELSNDQLETPTRAEPGDVSHPRYYVVRPVERRIRPISCSYRYVSYFGGNSRPPLARRHAGPTDSSPKPYPFAEPMPAKTAAPERGRIGDFQNALEEHGVKDSPPMAFLAVPVAAFGDSVHAEVGRPVRRWSPGASPRSIRLEWGSRPRRLCGAASGSRSVSVTSATRLPDHDAHQAFVLRRDPLRRVCPKPEAQPLACLARQELKSLRQGFVSEDNRPASSSQFGSLLGLHQDHRVAADSGRCPRGRDSADFFLAARRRTLCSGWFGASRMGKRDRGGRGDSANSANRLTQEHGASPGRVRECEESG